MYKTRILSLLTALVCLLSGICAAAGAEADGIYCFSAADFGEEASLAGICITALPTGGSVTLGDRKVQPGDVLTAGQLAQLTFSPDATETDRDVSVTYLPIYEAEVAPSATLTISIRGREDKAPVAEDFAVETYKNIPLQGRLKVQDPEGQPMTFTVTRQGRRGETVIHPDGSFTYTPKKNKVGVDSFTYTATDPAGKTSREATVTVTVMKSTDAGQYADTTGKTCQFAAEWMKNTGIFEGERVAGSPCFQPEKAVTKGEFLTMLLKTLEIPGDEAETSGQYADAPRWLQPYLTAALRAGLTAGLTDTLDPNAPITGGEAAVMLQNALDFGIPTVAGEESGQWTAGAIAALARHGITLDAQLPLTRAVAAETLYLVHQLAPEAPGTAVFRRQS